MDQQAEAVQEWFDTLQVGDTVKLSYPGVLWTVGSKSSHGFTAVRRRPSDILDGLGTVTNTRFVGPSKLEKAYAASTR